MNSNGSGNRPGFSCTVVSWKFSSRIFISTGNFLVVKIRFGNTDLGTRNPNLEIKISKFGNTRIRFQKIKYGSKKIRFGVAIFAFGNQIWEIIFGFKFPHLEIRRKSNLEMREKSNLGIRFGFPNAVLINSIFDLFPTKFDFAKNVFGSIYPDFKNQIWEDIFPDLEFKFPDLGIRFGKSNLGV